MLFDEAIVDIAHPLEFLLFNIAIERVVVEGLDSLLRASEVGGEEEDGSVEVRAVLKGIMLRE